MDSETFKRDVYDVLLERVRVSYAELSRITQIRRGLSRTLEALKTEGKVQYELEDGQVYDDMVITLVIASRPNEELKPGFEMGGKITITVGDTVYESDIDGEEMFTYHLRMAVRNGKDPAKALKFLADHGSRSVNEVSTSFINAIGQ